MAQSIGLVKVNIGLLFQMEATVYGGPQEVPITDDFPLSPANPYGRTKLVIEEILRDAHGDDSVWQVALFRYFNPVGAHELRGLILILRRPLSSKS